MIILQLMVDGVDGHVGHVDVVVHKSVLEVVTVQHLNVEEVAVMAQVLRENHVVVVQVRQ